MKQLLIWLHSCSLSDWKVCLGKNSTVLLAENRVMVFTCVWMWEWFPFYFLAFFVINRVKIFHLVPAIYFLITEKQRALTAQIVLGKTEPSPKLPLIEMIMLIILRSASPCCNILILSMQIGLKTWPHCGKPVYMVLPLPIFNALTQSAGVAGRIPLGSCFYA